MIGCGYFNTKGMNMLWEVWMTKLLTKFNDFEKWVVDIYSNKDVHSYHYERYLETIEELT